MLAVFVVEVLVVVIVLSDHGASKTAIVMS